MLMKHVTLEDNSPLSFSRSDWLGPSVAMYATSIWYWYGMVGMVSIRRGREPTSFQYKLGFSSVYYTLRKTTSLMLKKVSKIFELIALLVSYSFTFVSVLPKKRAK